MTLRAIRSLMIGLLLCCGAGCSSPRGIDSPGDQTRSEPLRRAAASVAPSGTSAATLRADRLRITGRVFADFGGAQTPIAGARVTIRELPSGRARSEVSDAGGRYDLLPTSLGRYELCVVAAGMTRLCDAPVVLDASHRQVLRNVKVRPLGMALRGRIMFADGEPCFYQSTLTEARTQAVVSTGRGRILANRAGEFVLGDLCGDGAEDAGCRALASGSQPLEISCGHSTVHREARLGRGVLDGTSVVELFAANHRPAMKLLRATLGGVAVRRARPGAVLTVSAEVEDADRDALHYTWIDGVTGDRLPSTGPEVSWGLPRADGRFSLHVEVSDGHGGFVRDHLSMPTSAIGPRVMGTISDADAPVPLAGAAVTIDGRTVEVDEEGNYRAELPEARGEAERHVVNVSMPGYPLMSRIARDAAPELSFKMHAATRRPIDPSERVELSESGIRVMLEKNSLVDAEGNHPRGLLTAETYRYRTGTDELPGDRSAVNADAEELRYQAHVAFFVRFVDSDGRTYDLARGKSATLHFPFPTEVTVPSLAPTSFSIAHYDTTQGRWTLGGEAVLTGDRYEAIVSHFSVWSLGSPGSDHACMKVVVDSSVPRPVSVRFFIPAARATEFPESGVALLHDRINLINHIPASTEVFVDVTPVGSPDTPLYRFTVNTGGPSEDHPAFPFDDCTSSLRISEQLPNTDQFFTRFPGSSATAQAYRNSLGGETFSAWKASHQYPGDQNEVVFFNPNELGLGRRVNCWIGGSNLAGQISCYVTKYGEVGTSPREMFDDTRHNTNPGDTVGMNLGASNAIEYFIWGPDGRSKFTTEFDNTGPKFFPDVCFHCHGLPGGTVPNGGNFNVLDIFAYSFPGVSAGSAHSLQGQQERFRKDNKVVANQHDQPDAYTNLLLAMYPGAALVTVGGQATNPLPPSIWDADPAFYDTVIRHNCRACHMWQTTFNWDLELGPSVFPDAEGFVGDACSGDMPQAMNPELNIWRNDTPPIAQLMRCLPNSYYLGNIYHAPVGRFPTLTVSLPGQTDYGQRVELVGHPHDADDGASCCAVTWSSNVDGLLGTGGSDPLFNSDPKTLEVAFPSPGVRIVSGIIRDSNGNLAEASGTINVVNSPPVPHIHRPSATMTTVFRNTPVAFRATATDPNEGTLPCASLTWTVDSNNGNFPKHACQFVATFANTGVRTVTVTAKDEQGAEAHATVQVTVVDAPAHQPPVITLVRPQPNERIPFDAPVTVKGAIADTDGAGATKQVVWKVVDTTRGGAVTVIHTESSTAASFNSTFQWVPSNDLTSNCGGRSVELRLEVTDPDGTTVESETVILDIGPC